MNGSIEVYPHQPEIKISPLLCLCAWSFSAALSRLRGHLIRVGGPAAGRDHVPTWDTDSGAEDRGKSRLCTAHPQCHYVTAWEGHMQI